MKSYEAALEAAAQEIFDQLVAVPNELVVERPSAEDVAQFPHLKEVRELWQSLDGRAAATAVSGGDIISLVLPPALLEGVKTDLLANLNSKVQAKWPGCRVEARSASLDEAVADCLTKEGADVVIVPIGDDDGEVERVGRKRVVPVFRPPNK